MVNNSFETEGVREFPIDVTLSVTTGRILCSGIRPIQELLAYMTGDKIYEQTIVRVMGLRALEIKQQLPELEEWGEPPASTIAAMDWAGEAALYFGEQHPIFPLGPEDHTLINPVDELRLMGYGNKILGTIIDEPNM